MFTSYEILKSLCDEFGITPSKMCEDIGSSKSLMSGLKAGRTKGINEKTAQAIADYFDVSLSRVMHGIDDSQSERQQISRAELNTILAYRAAPSEIKQIIDTALMPYLKELEKTRETPKSRTEEQAP